jgi:hypothetical protein
MRDPRRLTILWASTACYRDNFAFLFTIIKNEAWRSIYIGNELHTYKAQVSLWNLELCVTTWKRVLKSLDRIFHCGHINTYTCTIQIMSISIINPTHKLGFSSHDVRPPANSFFNWKVCTCDWDGIELIIYNNLVQKSLTRQSMRE